MTTTDSIETLLRDLAAAFVEKPEELRVASQGADDGAVYFALKGAVEDESKLVGTGGSHVAALSFLVVRFGLARGRPFTFRLLTERRPERRKTFFPADALKHDPEPSRALLVRLLESLGFSYFAIDVGPGEGPRKSLRFTFEIKPIVATDAERLLTPLPTHDPNNPMTIVEALGTLFRAIAKRNGVSYSVALKND